MGTETFETLPEACIADSIAVMSTWKKSYIEGNYVSTDGRFKAELRPAGYYAAVGCKLTRHYAIRAIGSDQIIGTACTLAKATERYL